MFCHSPASQSKCREIVGKINAAWRVAMATMGQNFTKEEHAAGWPETLKHWQLAALQYPHVKGETTKIRLARARANDFLNACKSGDLPHTLAKSAVFFGLSPKDRFSCSVTRSDRFAPELPDARGAIRTGGMQSRDAAYSASKNVAPATIACIAALKVTWSRSPTSLPSAWRPLDIHLLLPADAPCRS